MWCILTHEGIKLGGIAINDYFGYGCCSSLCVEAILKKEFEAILSVLVKSEALRTFQVGGL